MKVTTGILAAIVFSSATAHASVITLESQWCCAGMPGTLTFSYDDSTPDGVDDEDLVITNDSPQVGSYLNSIISASYVVNSGVGAGRTFSMLPGDSSSITIRKFPGVYGPASVLISANLYEGSDLFSMVTRIEGEPPLTDDLSNLPLTVKADDTYLAIGSFPLSPILYGDQRVFKQVASVPEPAILGLFVAGAIGLFGANRKRRDSSTR